MSGAPTPRTLLAAIASAASGGYITNPVPEDVTGTNAASVVGGFPPITMQSELSGGQPPLGQDMNGLFFLLSSHTLYVESGQLYLYNSDLSTALGGYLAGTVLGMADGSGMWLNVTDGNETDPDTGGAGWVPLTSYGFSSVGGLTGGSATLTNLQARRNVLVFSGTLLSNQTVVLPAWAANWLIINNCTGAFTLSVGAGGASSVIVPQGGFAVPVPVYGIGDGNIYPQSLGASLPAYSQSPTASTLAQRTNAGYLLATYFNQNSSSTENPAIGAVFVESTAADGYLRKAAFSYFAEQLNEMLVNGPVNPSAAENTIALTLSGGITGTSETQLLIKFGFWPGTITGAPAALETITFATPFPNGAIWGIANGYRQAASVVGANYTWILTATQMQVVLDQSPSTKRECYYLAIGY